MKILFALALLAAVGMCDEPDVSLVMYEAEGYEVDLPDKEYYKAIFEIPKEIVENTTGNVTLDIGFYYVIWSAGRKVTVYYNITNENNESLPKERTIWFEGNEKDIFEVKELTLDGMCDKGCTVHLWFYADCGKTCLFDITSFFWARMMDNSDHFFSNKKLPYMPLYEGSWSPYFENLQVDKPTYFTFNSTDELELLVEIETEGGGCVLVSGKGNNTTPSHLKPEWIVYSKKAQRDFVKGPNYLGLYCSESYDGERVRIRIGGAPLLVPYFILAVLAFFAL